MQSKLQNLWITVLVPIILIMGLFVFPTTKVNAALLSSNKYLGIHVSNTNIKNRSTVTISATWSSTPAHPIHAGDTLTINFPESSDVKAIGYKSTGALITSKGISVGTITVEANKAVLKFNNNINKFIDGSVSGTVTASFNISVSHLSNDGTKKVIIPVTKDKNLNPQITI